jgi:beta-ureidopropionase
MISILRAGLVQTAAPRELDDPDGVIEASLRQRLEEIEQAVRVGVQLLCFPELCCMPWFLGSPDTRWLAHAWEHDHPALKRVQRTAGAHRCVVVFPFLERRGESLHSSAAIIDADGTLRGLSRRLHVPKDQRGQIVGGPEAARVHDTDAGRIGIAVGHDLHLPEVARSLGLQGAEIILFPAATPTDRPRALWEAEPLAAASQNACWVGACNRVGSETLRGEPGARVLEFSGGSYLADSRGRFLARASRDQATAIRADLSLGRLRKERSKDPPHSLRRPDIYSGLVK